MTNDLLLMIGVFIIGSGALIGFFATKTKGYGRYTTSTFLILVSIVVSSIMYAAGKLDGQIMANVIFAVIGFAGGLFTGKEDQGTNKNSKNNND